MSTNQEKLNEQLFNVIADEKASDEARLKKVKYLVRLGADVNTRLYGKSVLSKALELQDEEVISFLKSKGAKELVISKEEALKLSLGFWDDKGDLKSLEEIKELLKKGADMEAKDGVGRTALIEAVLKGKLEVVKYFAQNGADLDAKDGAGRTALMTAANCGELDVVKCLEEHGVDVHQKDVCGDTALMKAAFWGKLDVVKYLVEHGADLEEKDGDGRTALMEAAYNNQLEVVKYLAECGADLEEKDGDGRTALDIAKKMKKADCVKFLEELQQKEKGNWKKGILGRMFGGRD